MSIVVGSPILKPNDLNARQLYGGCCAVRRCHNQALPCIQEIILMNGRAALVRHHRLSAKQMTLNH